MEDLNRPDEISTFKRALRADHRVRKPTDVSDAMRIDMILSKDRQEAQDVLQDCHDRLAALHPGISPQPLTLLHKVAFEWSRNSDLHTKINIDLILETLDFVEEHAEALGEDFSAYLSACLNVAKATHPEALDAHTRAEREGDYQPDWLGLAFNLRQPNNAGQPTDPERDADILDGMSFIVSALQEKSGQYSNLLEEKVHLFLNGKSQTLPTCIERLVVLNGYPQTSSYLASRRAPLADFIVEEIDRLKGRNKWRHLAAANIWTKCQAVCAEQVDWLLSRTDLPDANRNLLQERRRTLRDYGADKIGDATGFARLYRDHRNSIHPNIKRSATDRSCELDDIQSEIAKARKRKAALACPEVQQAVATIRSPDVGNSNRSVLLKLQKITPKEHRHIWEDLWLQLENRFRNAIS